MKEDLEALLSECNIKVLNPVWDDVRQRLVVGYHCIAPNIIGLSKNLRKVHNWIAENNSNYSITEFGGNSTGFIIYLNEK